MAKFNTETLHLDGSRTFCIIIKSDNACMSNYRIFNYIRPNAQGVVRQFLSIDLKRNRQWIKINRSSNTICLYQG